MKSNPAFYVPMKPRFKYVPKSDLVRIVEDRIELRPRNGSNKIYTIALAELTTQRAITIAVQHLTTQRWCSKEILTSFISVAMCSVPTETATPVDISHILRTS